MLLFSYLNDCPALLANHFLDASITNLVFNFLHTDFFNDTVINFTYVMLILSLFSIMIVSDFFFEKKLQKKETLSFIKKISDGYHFYNDYRYGQEKEKQYNN